MTTASPAASVAALPFASDSTAQAFDPDEAEGPQSAWRRESRLREAQHRRTHETQRQTRCQREERLRESSRNRP
ncbi:MAG TPA: hypothetical protein PLP22_00525 [Candidatus Competibacter sp.]|nr:hypothetical protein [Candidatus Competibacter sp.]HUM93769.1 hypothetical protein [Candidatus Competibacter sp.]